MTNFQDKIVLITGGTSGIGAACARSFMEHGARVIVAAKNEMKGEEFVRSVAAPAGQVIYQHVDLRDRESIGSLFKRVNSLFDILDIAINNAGIEGAPFTHFSNYPEEAWDEVISVNLTAVWLCMREELKIMTSQGSGAIVNVASLAGLRASVTAGCGYTASKHGVVGLTKSAALDYAKTAIRINAVCPGMVNTAGIEEAMINGNFGADVHPIGRICEPEEVAAVVRWLSSNEASYITGGIIPVDGGHMAG